ncbi:hypothetical protein VP01_2284g4 [Puccinia sorghi]|uniref:BZIP domain-containing protein n=1 Tax=Puccinia sorghi TaxID=27349 RepID=A0A0L6V898_9BASI|nr:hypothetical protein VP01_2284g4 [Puccinia sorghi]
MDSLAQASLPPTSHPVVAHSSIAYPHSVAYTSDYHEKYRKSSGVANPKIEMGEYYVPTNGTNTPYHPPQLPVPISPSFCRSSLPYLEDTAGKQHNLRPRSSSSLESDPKSQDEREFLNVHPNAYPFEYGYANTTCPSRPSVSSTSSENETQPSQKSPSRRLPVIDHRAGCNGLQELALPTINNQSAPDSRYSADEALIRQEEYPEDLCKADVGKSELSESQRSPRTKTAIGKKPSSLKVSEVSLPLALNSEQLVLASSLKKMPLCDPVNIQKRRQQNRAAQRAMRERRKGTVTLFDLADSTKQRAAQHQELHMSAILTENIMLREKVAYLSNILLSHAINPGGHQSWTPLLPQDNLPPMFPPHTAHPLARPAPVVDSTSSAISPSLEASHSMYPPASLATSSALPSTHGSMINYYPPGPLEFDYHQHGNGATGIRNFSGPSSTSNISRPGTAEELNVGSHAAAFSRWQTSTANGGVSLQNESSITTTMGQFGLVGSVSTDSCSINTASTIPSPTQVTLIFFSSCMTWAGADFDPYPPLVQTDGQLVDAIPTNL